MEKLQELDMDNAVGYLISHAAMRIKIGMRRVFQASGSDITPDQWVVLFRLRGKQGLTQSELGERTVKDKTTITRILDRLEAKALVVRHRDERDRRSQRIYLTENGSTALDALIPLAIRFGAELFSDVSMEERDVMRRLLARIEARLDTVIDSRDEE